MQPLLSDISVNGEVIPATAIAAEAQNHPAPKSKPGIAWMAAARALAIRALLLQEARRLGLVSDPQRVEGDCVETDDEALIRQLLDAELDPVEPTGAEVRAAYSAAPHRWRAPTLYEAAHILLPAHPGDAVARAEAIAEAALLIDRIRENPRAFDAIARERSACSSREAGGRLGQLNSGDTVPEFEAAMDALAEGAMTETPVETRYGIHIVRLDARARGEVLPFETVAPRIFEILEKRAWARAAQDYVARLIESADVAGITLRAA